MGFPIVVGGRSSSSRPIAPPSPVPEDAIDGTPLVPVVVATYHRTAVALDGHGLCATISVSYYDMVRSDNDTVETTVAEMRVQISPFATPYSSKNREMLHRISLPPPDGSSKSRSWKLNEVSAVFSSDGLSLACLFPYPRHAQSAVVIFQLRKPRVTSSSKPRPPPPRPSYLASSPPSSQPLVPIATNPRLMTGPDGSLVVDITAICDASSSPTPKLRAPSVLVAGCRDGTVLAIAYRRATIAGVLEQSPFGGDTIACLQHVTERTSDNGNSRGKLAVVRRNGTALVYVSHLVLGSADGDEEQTRAPDTERTSNGQKATLGNCLFIRIDPLIVLMADHGPTHPFIRVQWIGGKLLALLVKPQEGKHVAAQVWAVYSDRSAEAISALTMTSERLQEDAHGSFALDIELESTMKQATSAHDGVINGTCSLHFDTETGCLAVSSVILSRSSLPFPPVDNNEALSVSSRERLTARPYVCVWHWLTDVVGLTLVSRQDCRSYMHSSRFFSQLYLSHDKQSGNHLVHAIARLKRDNHTDIRMRKEVHRVSILSPSQSIHRSVCAIEESSSLMISSNSVSFPFVSHPSASQDCEIVWKESGIPSSYIAAYGPPLIASIGSKRGVSIAVAASRGLCICDTTKMNKRTDCTSDTKSTKERTEGVRRFHPKWRLFGSEAEEKGFRVLAMTWWEASDADSQGHSLSDDVLVAVIQSEGDSSFEGADQEKPKFLACWSRRRVDFGGQLLKSRKQRGKLAKHRGIPLPMEFDVSSLSILDEPTSSLNGGRSRRSIVLLSSHSHHSFSNGGFSYWAYQLHLVSDKRADNVSFQVLGNVCSGGHVTFEGGGETSSVFLAGASFKFDLTNDDDTRSDENEFVATLGVIRTPGYGLDSVTITSSGPSTSSQVVADITPEESQMAPLSQVSKYWLSDVVDGSRWSVENRVPASCQVDSFFVWVIELCDGNLGSWFVPYLDNRHASLRVDPQHERGQSKTITRRKKKSLVASTVTLRPPIFVRESGANDDVLAGIVCFVGSASDWIGDVSTANRHDFTLGCLPASSFGCILSAGQVSRKFHRVVPGQFDSCLFPPNFLDHEVLALSEFILGPPCFVASVFASLLTFVSLRSQNRTTSKEVNVPASRILIDHDVLKQHALYRLRSASNKAWVTTGLRLLTLRTVEALARESLKKGSNPDRYPPCLALPIFAELVEGLRCSVTAVEFVSLFLGVGRQIEPSCFSAMFPLPLRDDKICEESMVGRTSNPSVVERCLGRTVEDLYDSAVQNGSISIAASALPLFSSKPLTHKKCTELLHHCFKALESNIVSDDCISYDTSWEGRQLLRDLFRFGVKLEEANSFDDTDHDRSVSTEAIHETTGSGDAREKDPLELSSPPAVGLQEELAPTNNQVYGESPSVLSTFLPFLWSRRKKRKELEEQAIYEAASMFILSGFEKDDFDDDLASMKDNTMDADTASHDAVNSNISTVAGMTSRFLLSHVCNGRVEVSLRWRKVLLLSRLVMGENQDFTSSSSIVGKCRETIGAVEWSDLAVRAQGFAVLNDEDIPNTTAVNGRNQDKERTVVSRCLSFNIAHCEMEINTEEACFSLNLILWLLSRRSADVQAVVSGLVIVGVVLGHVARRIDDVTVLCGPVGTELHKCYLVAIGDFAGSKQDGDFETE